MANIETQGTEIDADDTMANNHSKIQDTEEPNEEGTSTDRTAVDMDDSESPLRNPEVSLKELVNPINLNIKHPLQNCWALWYDNPGKKPNPVNWGDNLKKMVSFDTVEDFWRIYNNIKPASALSSGSNYHLFKDHIEPKWEDVQNSKGGKWVVQIPPKNKKDMLDQIWLYAVLACIGESLEFPDEVCGVVVSLRKAHDRLQLWTKDATSEATVKAVGRTFKQVLELPDNFVVGYQSHQDSQKRASKNRYEV